jgi:hypothetical protein
MEAALQEKSMVRVGEGERLVVEGGRVLGGDPSQEARLSDPPRSGDGRECGPGAMELREEPRGLGPLVQDVVRDHGPLSIVGIA